MARSDKGMIFFYDWRETFEELTGNECKALLLAMLDYCQNDTEPPKFKGKTGIAASFIFSFLKRSKQNARAGKKGMNNRYNDVNNENVNGVNNGDITALGNINQDINKNKNQDYNQDKNYDAACNGSEAARRFETFWKSYPKKIGKAAAMAAFKRLNPDAELFDSLMSALELHKLSAQWTKDGGQYIPNPVTWIDQMRWEDELPAPAEPSNVNGSFGTDEFFQAALAKSLRVHDNSTEEGENYDQNRE